MPEDAAAADPENAAGPDERSVCDCKVGTVANRYGVDDVAAALEAMWTAEGEERHSLRELARTFNEHLVEAALREAGTSPLTGEAENLYRLLTDDDASPGDRVQARRRLSFEGVPVEDLEESFVTHQTVYRHLRDCRGAEYERDDDPATRRDREVERIDGFRNRLRLIAEEGARRLAAHGDLGVENPRAVVDVRIQCGDCGASRTPTELRANRTCDCRRDD